MGRGRIRPAVSRNPAPGANPLGAMAEGEYAETLVSVMAGAADMFDLFRRDAKTASGNKGLSLSWKGQPKGLERYL